MTLTLNEEPIPDNADVIYVGDDPSHFCVAHILSFATPAWSTRFRASRRRISLLLNVTVTMHICDVLSGSLEHSADSIGLSRGEVRDVRPITVVE